MSTINQQTAGPVVSGRLLSLIGRGITGLPTETVRANRTLLAAAYTSYDKAGRELGVDATKLAQSVDLAALVRAAVQAQAFMLTKPPGEETHLTTERRAAYRAIEAALPAEVRTLVE